MESNNSRYVLPSSKGWISQNQGGFGAVFGNQGVRIGVGNPAITQFKNEQGDTIVQLSSNMLTVNRVPEYKAWENFMPSIIKALNTLKNLMEINTIERIGLKYINKINAGEKHSFENFTKLFNLYPYTVDGFKYDTKSIQLNIEFPIKKKKEVLSVLIATLKEEQEYMAPILFQLYSTYISREAFDIPMIQSWLDNRAHLQLNEAFQSFLTEDCKKSFD